MLLCVLGDRERERKDERVIKVERDRQGERDIRLGDRKRPRDRERLRQRGRGRGIEKGWCAFAINSSKNATL